MCTFDAALNSNRLETLKGTRKGQCSIRVNDQWRLCFEWPKDAPGPTNVEIVDYHDSNEHSMARTPIHPGEILADELEEVCLSAKKLANGIEVPPNRLYQLTSGKINLTGDTALRQGQYFGMPVDFWMNLQSADELDLARSQNGNAIQKIPRRDAVASVSLV